MFNQQQGQMNEPPSLLTNKDVLYLQDALSWELLAVKKAHNLAQNCQDSNIGNHFEQIANMHQQHYQMLLRHLEPQSQQQNQQTFNNQSFS